jgi:hypothetical protein
LQWQEVLSVEVAKLMVRLTRRRPLPQVEVVDVEDFHDVRLKEPLS